MNFPKISIVVPSFNQGQFLEETLVSIISQEYPDLELLVADGGSTDQSVEIIKKYEKHITWWVSEKDKGQSDAINKGFQRATGEIMNWICSDDLLKAGSLRFIADSFYRKPDTVGVIHGGSYLFREEKHIEDNRGYKKPSLERNLAGMAFPQPSAFFLRKYADRAGRYVSTSWHYGMDYDLYSRLALVCEVVAVPEILTGYRLHDSSKSVKGQEKFIGDWNRIFVNICRNLHWDEILDELNDCGFYNGDILNYYEPFAFEPDMEIVKRADRKEVLFFHHCYSLKAMYWSGRLDEARSFLRFLKKKYPSGWLQTEKDIPGISRKLALPAIVLNTLKRLKRI